MGHIRSWADEGTRTADGRQVTQLVVTPDLEEHPRTVFHLSFILDLALHSDRVAC